MKRLKSRFLDIIAKKLAIAFGLLNTPENTTLRIMKNLTLCLVGRFGEGFGKEKGKGMFFSHFTYLFHFSFQIPLQIPQPNTVLESAMTVSLQSNLSPNLWGKKSL
ncbi:hypothetical protein ACSBR1_014490 [Camellia fascicularis]